MAFYDDNYNRKVAGKVLERSARNATHIDRLNGAGDTTKKPVAVYNKQQNAVFENDIQRNLVQPRSVVEERARYDLGSGKYSGGSGMVGFPDRAPMSAVESNSIIRERAGLDLGAGKSGGFLDIPTTNLFKRVGKGHSGAGLLRAAGGAMLRQKFEAKEMGRGAVTSALRGGLPHGMKKMAAQMSKMLLKRAKGRGLSGGARYEIDLEKDENSDEEDCDMEGGAMPLHATGCGEFSMADRQVGGRCCPSCKCKCGSGMSGGYGNFSPTTEALGGYDNRDQPKGLRPPPSVNQQRGMCGSGASGGATLRSGRRTTPKPSCCFPAAMCRGTKKYKGGATQPVSLQQMGRSLLPQDQLPSGIGGAKMQLAVMPKRGMADEAEMVTQGSKMQDRRYRGEMQAMGRGDLAMTTNYASNSGAIIPELQSRKSNIGSGARASRGAMVSQLMREKGMSLGEASRYIKEHRMGSGVGNS